MIETRPNSPTFDSWKKRFLEVAIEHREAQWNIGDLLCEGLELFPDEDGSDVWTVAEVTGLAYQTLANYKSVASRFPKGQRRLNVAHGIHAVIVSLDEPVRETILDAVEKHGWTREEVTKRARAYKSGDLEALSPKWKPVQKTIEVDEASFTAGGKNDDDKPVFDNGDCAAGMDAERAEKLDAYRDQDLNDANQDLFDALIRIEKATALSRVALMNRDRLPYDRIRSAIHGLQALLPKEPKTRPVTISAPVGAGGSAAPVTPVEAALEPGVPASQKRPAPTFTDDDLELPEFLRREGAE